MTPSTMQAAVVNAPGGPEVLTIETRPVPEPRAGWVLVRVHAFGLNRAELVTRSGGSGDSVRFPRVLGIECVGEVVDAGGGDLAPGQAVVVAMGGMGRDFDGGYQQYALLPQSRVTPVETTLDWPTLGALPESFGTAWGSLETLGLESGDTLLVRGGSSSVGMDAASLAAARGLTVLSTTRNPDKLAAVRASGAQHALLDDDTFAGRVREIAPDGVHGVLELVGPATFLESLTFLRPGAAGCVTGFLEGVWDTSDAEAAAERAGVRLTYFGSAALSREAYGAVFQEIVDGVQDGRYPANLDRTFPLAEIADAHRYMEANRAAGKVVVLPG
jgi:NADPH:quinone reductase-like Zn-dependent oxidoreductase